MRLRVDSQDNRTNLSWTKQVVEEDTGDVDSLTQNPEFIISSKSLFTGRTGHKTLRSVWQTDSSDVGLVDICWDQSLGVWKWKEREKNCVGAESERRGTSFWQGGRTERIIKEEIALVQLGMCAELNRRCTSPPSTINKLKAIITTPEEIGLHLSISASLLLKSTRGLWGQSGRDPAPCPSCFRIRGTSKGLKELIDICVLSIWSRVKDRLTLSLPCKSRRVFFSSSLISVIAAKVLLH